MKQMKKRMSRIGEDSGMVCVRVNSGNRCEYGESSYASRVPENSIRRRVCIVCMTAMMETRKYVPLSIARQ